MLSSDCNSSEGFKLGNATCLLGASNAAIRQSSPASIWEMKYLRVSRGAANGCRLARRRRNPSSRLPLENATFAKRAEVVNWASAAYNPKVKSSINLLLAPMRLVGLAALSVDTAKYSRP